MTIERAIEAYMAATSETEVNMAYEAMLQWSDAPEGSEEDDIDHMLNLRGLPSLSQRLITIECSRLEPRFDSKNT